jgi:hypothetical protein
LTKERVERRLAAILAADVVGYSRFGKARPQETAAEVSGTKLSNGEGSSMHYSGINRSAQDQKNSSGRFHFSFDFGTSRFKYLKGRPSRPC